MIEISFDDSFKRAFKKRFQGNHELERKFRIKLEKFKENPFDPSLRVMTSKNMRVNARLDSDRANKFNYIRQRTNQGVSDIVKAAIDLYYEKLYQESSVKPLQLLRESGLIGCAEGDSDLSVNYKQYLTESLNEKYGHR